MSRLTKGKVRQVFFVSGQNLHACVICTPFLNLNMILKTLITEFDIVILQVIISSKSETEAM